MTDVQPLHSGQHAKLRFDRSASGAARQLVQVGLSEIALAAADMPLCLVKDVRTGRFSLVALLGFEEGTNLFVAEGRIHATYWPRAASLSAFRLDDRSATGLAIDTRDPAISGTSGEQLFTDGAPAAFLQGVHDAIHAVISDVSATQRLIDAYVARRLVQPLGLLLREDAGHESYVSGLYTLDADRIKNLSDADVIALHRLDGLATAGVLAASLAQVERLRQLHNARYPNRTLSPDMHMTPL